jgi:hypothetical protein
MVSNVRQWALHIDYTHRANAANLATMARSPCQSVGSIPLPQKITSMPVVQVQLSCCEFCKHCPACCGQYCDRHSFGSPHSIHGHHRHCQHSVRRKPESSTLTHNICHKASVPLANMLNTTVQVGIYHGSPLYNGFNDHVDRGSH